MIEKNGQPFQGALGDLILTRKGLDDMT